MIWSNSRQEVEVIVNDAVVNRYAGDIDELGSGHAQKEQHAQHPFLIMNGSLNGGQHFLVHCEAGDDDDGLWGQIIQGMLIIPAGQGMLQGIEILMCVGGGCG